MNYNMSRPKDNFEAVRLLASIAVIYGHAHALTGVASNGVFGSTIQALAVKVFFVVSGFLVSESWRRDPSAIRYLSRRALRIFPALVVVTISSIIVAGPILTKLPLQEYFTNSWTWTYLGNILLRPSYSLPGVFADNIYPSAVNGSLWTLPVEFAMYLALPAIALVGRGLRFRVAGGCILLCIASLYLVRFTPGPLRAVFYGTDWISALDVAPFFLLGAVWQIVLPRRFLSSQSALLLVLLSATLPLGRITDEVALYLILPYAVLSFATATPAVFGWLGRFGDFSYGIYIYGFFVQQTIAHYLKTDGRPLLNFSLALPVTLLLAASSWHIVEKPFLRLKPTRNSVKNTMDVRRGTPEQLAK
jgi:peptidoglycan/LPS O-acetylase OafA/YrhL